MKQKIVIRVSLPCHKCRAKAMKLAATAHGVSSLAIDGDDDKLEVIGDGIDATGLVICLRKEVGHAEIVLVEDVKDKKPDDEKKPEEEACCHAQPYCYAPPPYPMVVCDEPGCSIM
ncbi:hypothetical protein ABZP36_004165 [Zizania latifolia]